MTEAGTRVAVDRVRGRGRRAGHSHDQLAAGAQFEAVAREKSIDPGIAANGRRADASALQAGHRAVPGPPGGARPAQVGAYSAPDAGSAGLRPGRVYGCEGAGADASPGSYRSRKSSRMLERAGPGDGAGQGVRRMADRQDDGVQGRDLPRRASTSSTLRRSRAREPEMRRGIGTTWCCAGGMLWLLVAAAGAQDLVDNIVADRGQEPDLRQRCRAGGRRGPLRAEGSRGEALPADSAALAALRAEMLESLIDRRLVIAKAKKEGIEVTATEVEDGLDQWLGDLVQVVGVGGDLRRGAGQAGVVAGRIQGPLPQGDRGAALRLQVHAPGVGGDRRSRRTNSRTSSTPSTTRFPVCPKSWA